MKCENEIDGNCIETLDKCKSCEPSAASAGSPLLLDAMTLLSQAQDFCLRLDCDGDPLNIHLAERISGISKRFLAGER